MSLTFRELAPALAAQVEGISRFPLIRYINETVWVFAIIETVHLLFLAILGGSVLALNLRLLGVVLRDMTAQDVERATRPWLRAGIWGTVITGIAMGLTTMTTLLGSAAFFVKIVALVAAILLSSSVARDVRRGNDGSSGERMRVLVALSLWLVALLLFSTTSQLGPGAFLVALAGFALFGAILGRHRRIYLAMLVLVFGGGLIASAVIDEVFIGYATIVTALVLAGVLGGLELRGASSRPFTPNRLAAFASTLAWVTVAAAGRWIGFS